MFAAIQQTKQCALDLSNCVPKESSTIAVRSCLQEIVKLCEDRQLIESNEFANHFQELAFKLNWDLEDYYSSNNYQYYFDQAETITELMNLLMNDYIFVPQVEQIVTLRNIDNYLQNVLNNYQRCESILDIDNSDMDLVETESLFRIGQTVQSQSVALRDHLFIVNKELSVYDQNVNKELDSIVEQLIEQDTIIGHLDQLEINQEEQVYDVAQLYTTSLVEENELLQSLEKNAIFFDDLKMQVNCVQCPNMAVLDAKMVDLFRTMEILKQISFPDQLVQQLEQISRNLQNVSNFLLDNVQLPDYFNGKLKLNKGNAEIVDHCLNLLVTQIQRAYNNDLPDIQSDIQYSVLFTEQLSLMLLDINQMRDLIE